MNLFKPVQTLIQQTIRKRRRGIARLDRRWNITFLAAMIIIGGCIGAGLIISNRRATAPITPPAAPQQQSTAPAHAVDPAASSRTYPQHTRIVATTFWVGEVFKSNVSDGSQVCSTYDKLWALHWSGGINKGRSPAGTACEGAPYGGCDGISSANGLGCETEPRTVANGYFPHHITPAENPFYLDIPFDDLNDQTAFAHRCQVIPWANDPGYSGHCADPQFSYMKNRWVKLIGPNGGACYGQIEDAGPSHDSLYHDSAYVFGGDDRQPVQGQFNNAGVDVSPALNGCLGFSELNGENDRVSWQFVDDAAVPAGPWRQIVTISGVNQ